MSEVILTIQLIMVTLTNQNIDSFQIDNFPSVSACETFYAEWKNAYEASTAHLSASSEDPIKVNLSHQCVTKPLINRKFG